MEKRAFYFYLSNRLENTNSYENIPQKFKDVSKMKNLRTFLALPIMVPKYMPSKVMHDLVLNLRSLRAISYWLPDFVVELFNPQTVKLCGSQFLADLSSGIGNLIDLNCLDIICCFKLAKLPLAIGKLTNLHMLSDFIVGAESGMRFTELKNLSKLQGRFCIRGLQNVVDIRDTDLARIKENRRIEELKLEWDGLSRNLSNEVEALD
ncbi:hypothetical protein RCOM_0065810 [Ricinus communis]|uniref:R13L1/DRL21-like LRR repeat region domain-containing protein n=1 Tax=Ricinus communis TaxID=3988 RepID=B9SZK1_RICCO|nr:hypothetical protein RCOM_0065810 [Ricinus communis]